MNEGVINLEKGGKVMLEKEPGGAPLSEFLA